jgi:hypothetical protein
MTNFPEGLWNYISWFLVNLTPHSRHLLFHGQFTPSYDCRGMRRLLANVLMNTPRSCNSCSLIGLNIDEGMCKFTKKTLKIGTARTASSNILSVPRIRRYVALTYSTLSIHKGFSQLAWKLFSRRVIAHMK